jgi:glycyl-tRNA synthetase
MHLAPFLAPYKAAILPLSKQLNDKAESIFKSLIPYINVTMDVTGSIGKRYRRNDEIGTPYCVTYDFDSDKDNCVTVRDRDSMKQERIEISKLKDYLMEKCFYK